MSGLLIDRAFPNLEAGAAAQRRALTMSAVVSITRIAQERNVDAIVVVGGLFDERSVGVEALPAVLSVLSAFEGRILVAPGTKDPFTPAGVYATTTWGDRVHVWGATEFGESVQIGATRVMGCATTGWSRASALPDEPDDNPILLVAEGITEDRAAAWSRLRAKRHVITTGNPELSSPGVTMLAAVNADIGDSFGSAAVINLDVDGAVSVERLTVLDGAPAAARLDVSTVRDDNGLRALFAAAARSAVPWTVIKLTGTLAPGVLLPSTAGWSSARPEIVIDESEVDFAFAAPDSADRTALAEFLRSIADEPVDDRTRHQAIALGLAALNAPVFEQGEP
ncbi:hypothetical protein J2X85_004231 [Microbacterium trichothecenolyticum]|uniref:hypothetical protein n=1 Tax=Microbacterium trichothecenolyticum TaxID=69370 RepID=UPI0028627781|nr:hypothetical protein [Microbacterium trichothecenolyticum]MDR7187161.1 hypothetical protein [Microbacterium trichothecenolyticum]